MANFISLVVFSTLVFVPDSNGRTRPLNQQREKDEYPWAQDLKRAGKDSNGCVDERDDCKWIEEVHGYDETAIEDYCKTWKDSEAIQQCRETCGFCSKVPHPPMAPQTAKPETNKPTEKPTEITSAAPKEPQPTGETLSGFQKECLKVHNEYRYLHDVPLLKWSSKLTSDAQAWTNRLLATISPPSILRHDPTARERNQGENLYYTTRYKKLCDYGEQRADCLSCEEVVKAWYNEEKYYDYYTGKPNKPGEVVFHFTQIIWRDTTQLGMTAAFKDGYIVAVARYSPVGNWLNEFTENVPPPKFP